MMIALLAIAILRNDGSVEYTESRPRVEHHHHYGNRSNSQFDYQAENKKWFRDKKDEIDRDFDGSNDYQDRMFQQDLLRLLKEGNR